MQQISTVRQSMSDVHGAPSARWVLDTNVVLDVFVFQDRRCSGLAAALAAAPGGWVATPAMRAEFDAVMGRRELAPWAPRLAQAHRYWVSLARLVDAAPRCDLRCADPGDQIFLDLALAQRPCWLLSRDADVLKLRRPAAGRGIRIVSPADWDAQNATGRPDGSPR